MHLLHTFTVIITLIASSEIGRVDAYCMLSARRLMAPVFV